MILAILTLSFNLQMGYTGIMSFCHAAFYGIGAYCSALLVMRLGISSWLAILIAAIFTATIAACVGYPSLKIKHVYFAMTTQCFGWFVTLVITNWDALTGGPMGLLGIPPPDPIQIPFIGAIHFNSLTSFYFLALALLSLIFLFIFKIINSKIGRIFIAIREDERLAECLGVNTSLYKLLSFTIGAFLASIAGSFYAHYFQILSPYSFTMLQSIGIFAMAMFGGKGTIVGPLMGAVFLTIVYEGTRFFKEMRYVSYGIAMVVTILFIPDGIWGTIKKKFMKAET